MTIVPAFRPALVLFVAFTLLTGLAYPFFVTGFAHAWLARPANGSLVERDGRVVGSRLIGQNFTAPGHFWGRPSATSPQPNNASASSGSNLGPLNPALVDAVRARIDALRKANQDLGVSDPGPVPVDLVTASASGLDPDLGAAAIAWQAPRVAKASGIATERLQALIAAHTEGPQWGLLGAPRVNVLALNLAVDAEVEAIKRAR